MDNGATRCVATNQIIPIAVDLELGILKSRSCYSRKQSVIIVSRHGEYRIDIQSISWVGLDKIAL